jgi:membrane protein
LPLPAAASRLLQQLTNLVRWLVEPLLRFDLVDRSLALGAQAFGALIPLLIVLQAVQPGQQSIAGEIIERFGLHDDAATTVEEAFAVTSGETTITGFSVLVLVVSVLSFTRRLQRLYEATWEFEPRGFRNTGWGLGWLAFFALYASLIPALDGVFEGLVGLVLSLAGVFVFGLATPYLLLGARLPWSRLVMQAGLTAMGLTLLGVWSAIYMPRAIESSASAYGAIGVAFALLTWLWGIGIVLVVAAVYGSPQVRWPSAITRPG